MAAMIGLALLAGWTPASMAAVKAASKNRQTPVGKAVSNDDLAVSLGVFFPTSSDASDVIGTGFGITAEKMIGAKKRFDIYGSLGFVGFSNSIEGTDVSEHIIPAMVTLMPRQASKSRGAKFYYGGSLGLTFTKLDYSDSEFDGSDSKIDFAWQLVGGSNLNDKLFAEAKYLSGGREANTVFSLNVGTRF